jgi:MOSC domain-containing protein YiiM
MKLLSVNIGQKRTQQKGNELETTGIYKLPIQGPVEIKSLGIQTDAICDEKNHGGPDQAIYIYGKPDYDWWSKELGKELGPGTFGDNLTISGLESAGFQIGDRLHVGSTILEVTAPRTPCGTLARRMGDSHFVRQYRYAERPGLYCRVIQEGSVQTGYEVKIERYNGKTISILQMFRDHFDKDKNEETLRRTLRAPIAVRARLEIEEDLKTLLSKRGS